MFLIVWRKGHWPRRDGRTHQHPSVGGGLPVGEVADGPGQVVGGHAGRAQEVVGHPAVVVGHGEPHGHVGQGQVRALVPQADLERGLVDGLVETREGLAGVRGGELSHGQEPAGNQSEGTGWECSEIENTVGFRLGLGWE